MFFKTIIRFIYLILYLCTVYKRHAELPLLYVLCYTNKLALKGTEQK